jgi:hypothetical protein
MFPKWSTATGFVMVVECVGVPIVCGAAGNEFLPPWEAYHRALNDAQAARGHFLREGVLSTARLLRDRICRQS